MSTSVRRRRRYSRRHRRRAACTAAYPGATHRCEGGSSSAPAVAISSWRPEHVRPGPPTAGGWKTWVGHNGKANEVSRMIWEWAWLMRTVRLSGHVILSLVYCITKSLAAGYRARGFLRPHCEALIITSNIHMNQWRRAEKTELPLT